MSTSTATRRRGTTFDGRALAAFFALAYALSWAWALPLAATGSVVHRGQGWPTHYPALLGPAIAAVLVTAWTLGRPGLADLGRRLVRSRVGLRWWLVATSPAAFFLLALLAPLIAGEDPPPVADFGLFSGTPAIVVWHGVYNIVGGTQAATGVIAAVVSTLIMVQAAVLVVLEVRARRSGRPSVLGPAS
jgi:hypothetical protein